ncbi:hypothetical protein ACJX0J_033443, partial [Zea mays]
RLSLTPVAAVAVVFFFREVLFLKKKEEYKDNKLITGHRAGRLIATRMGQRT